MYKTNLNANGSINKHKAILAMKGYAQIPGWITQTHSHQLLT